MVLSLVGDSPPKMGAYHHGDLREALLSAAIAVISESDVEAVSLRELARRVGVSYAAPYHHFKDKNALLAAVAQQGFGLLHERLLVARADAGSPREQFVRLGRAYVGFAIDHPSHYRVMFGPDRDRASYPELHAAGFGCFGELLSAAGELLGESATEDRVRTVALTAWSAVHGFATLWNDGPMAIKFEGLALDGLLDRLIESLLVGLEPSGPSGAAS